MSGKFKSQNCALCSDLSLYPTRVQCLKLCTLGCSWKCNHIADIGHTGYKLYHSFKSKSKASMWHRSKSSRIQVPPQFFDRNIHFFHSCSSFPVFLLVVNRQQFLQYRGQYIHGGNGFAIIVLPHVKSFDIFWIVGKDHRFFKMFFYQVTFMFTLQINSPFVDRILKFLFLIVIDFLLKFQWLRYKLFFQNHCLSNKFQFFNQAHFTAFILWQLFFFFCQSLRKEFQIFPVIVHRIFDNIS